MIIQNTGFFRGHTIAAGLLMLAAAFSVAAQESNTGGAGSQATINLNGQTWALATNGEDVGWNDAAGYCENLQLAGHDDWRLPAISELEALHDPGRDAKYRIATPLPTSTCCLWSATSLAEEPPEPGHFYVDPRLGPESYAWGYLYAEEGIRYYSSKSFPDGQALCVRNP